VSVVITDISLVSLGCKLLSMKIVLRLRDSVNKDLGEEQRDFKKGRECIDQIFTLRLIIEKCLSYKTPLVQQAFDSANRRSYPCK